MSLYNLLFGVNPYAWMLLDMLDKSPEEFKRFRDIYLEDDATIAVYTRNGGGNREHYDERQPAGVECPCTGCFMQYHVQHMEGYIRDEDDSFDQTFATIWFRVPDWAVPALDLIPKRLEGKTPRERWQELLRKLNDPNSKDDPDVQRAVKGMEPIIDQIIAFANEGKKE